MNVLVENLLDASFAISASTASSSKQTVKKTNAVLFDIQLDLESFTFGLSELSMLVDEQSELGERITLLKNCVEGTERKVDILLKLNESGRPI